MVLITGASGSVGGAVLNAIRSGGVPVRAMYRTQKDASKAASGVQCVLADYADVASLKKAVEGIDTVFLVCSPIPKLVELEGNVIDTCALQGVKHIVLNSALGAGDYPKSFPSWHRKVEEKLKTSGMAHTILRPNGFMQNILAYNAPSIRTQGAFYASMGNARTSFIDVRDIAAVAASILNSPSAHAGKIYELNGPEAVTNQQLAEKISRVAGRQVKYVDIPEAVQQKSMLDLGMPAWQVTALLELQQYYKNGQGGEITDVLPRLLGRDPMHLDQFLQEFKSSFAAQAGA